MMTLLLQGSLCVEIGHFIQLSGPRESPGGGKISWSQPGEGEGKKGYGESRMYPWWMGLQGPQVQRSKVVTGALLIHTV